MAVVVRHGSVCLCQAVLCALCVLSLSSVLHACLMHVAHVWMSVFLPPPGLVCLPTYLAIYLPILRLAPS